MVHLKKSKNRAKKKSAIELLSKTQTCQHCQMSHLLTRSLKPSTNSLWSTYIHSHFLKSTSAYIDSILRISSFCILLFFFTLYLLPLMLIVSTAPVTGLGSGLCFIAVVSCFVLLLLLLFFFLLSNHVLKPTFIQPYTAA